MQKDILQSVRRKGGKVKEKMKEWGSRYNFSNWEECITRDPKYKKKDILIRRKREEGEKLQ